MIIKTITAVYNNITRRSSMKRSDVPAIAGVSKNGVSQLTFTSGEVKTRGRTKNPYALNNIGKRIWNPLTQSHVDNQEFYKLAREESIFLNELACNRHVDDVNEGSKFKFDGKMSETQWLCQMGLELRPDPNGGYSIYEASRVIEAIPEVVETTKTLDEVTDVFQRKIADYVLMIEAMKKEYDILSKHHEEMKNWSKRVHEVVNKEEETQLF